MPLELSNEKELLAEADRKGMRKALVVTAIALELEAVRAELKNVGSVITPAGVFEFEQFTASGQEWLVVTGECSAGNLPAMAFITTAIQRFGPFEVIIFVGVAGSRKVDDAPIGSVLIGKHIYLAETGKYKNGQFQGRARMIEPDKILLALAQKIARDRLWLARLKPPYGATSPSDDAYPKPYPPAAILCPIVSVEAVSADMDSTLEQHINQTYQDAVGVEMEGYGALFSASNEQTPCIVVRGVSDAIVGKGAELDKISQPIAVGHAVAFAFELLDAWSHNIPAPASLSVSKPPDAVAPSSSQEPSAIHVSSTAKATPARVSIVINLSGSADDYPEETQAQILQAVREATKDPEAEIVGVEQGSFHIFVELSESAWKVVGSETLRSFLAERFDGIESVTTASGFREARASRDAMKTASLPLTNWPQKLPDGTIFARPELTQLLDRLKGSEGTTTALLGEPGSGKTALLAALGNSLAANGVSFLAIKADFLGPDVSTEEHLQEHLNLPDKPSNLIVDQARIAPAVLIVDQLDALAGYLDIRTGRLSALLNLIRKLGGRSNVHVVLSARTFEFEHDVRLKSVNADSVRLELPPWSSVLKVLETHGVDAKGWPADARQVLRSPQSLSTFLKLSKQAQRAPNETYQGMLEKLWQERLLSAPDGAKAARLAGTLAEDMATKETLWAAAAQYDEHSKELALLEGVGILSRAQSNPGSIGFSHQTVFDFSLARSFAQDNGKLSKYISDRQASLFIRPKLWAAFTYLRGVDRYAYEAELRAIWLLNLRPHLRHLVLDFLGQQQGPTPVEEEIFRSALRGIDRRTALHAMVGSSGWFKMLANTAVSDAMQRQNELSIAVGILSRASQTASKEVLDLVEKNWMLQKEFDNSSWYVLQEMPNWDERALGIAKLIIDRSEVSSHGLDYTISIVGAKQPEYAMRLALAGLERRLSLAKVEAERRSQMPRSEDAEGLRSYLESPKQALENVVERTDGWDSLEPLAKTDPPAFLRILWPWMLDLLAALRKYDTTYSDIGFAIKYGVDLRFNEEGKLGLPEHAILAAFRSALETYAAQEGSGFEDWLDAHQNEDAQPAQRLFAHALSHAPEKHAQRALKFLLDDPRRLFLGNIEDMCGTTRRLVRTVSPYWSVTDVQSFEKVVRSYAPQPTSEREVDARRAFYHLVDRVKVSALEELPRDKLSAETLRYIAQERRRFGGGNNVGVTYSGPTWIGSSMSSESMAKARDEDVVHAFQDIPDDTAWDHPRQWMKGGNIQLSRAFADFAKQDPTRASRIILKFTPETGGRAAGYALDAMAETVDPHLITTTVRELEKRGFASEEYRVGVAGAFGRLLRREIAIDDDMLDMLIQWLESPGTQEADDESESSEAAALDEVFDENEKGSDDRSKSVLWGMGGGSVLPHGNYPILETVTRILLQRRDPDRLLQVWQDHLQRSEEEAVWAALLLYVRYISKSAQGELEKFLNALIDKYPAIIASHELAIGLAYIRGVVPGFVERMLKEWMASSSQKLQKTYGEVATLIWLTQKEAKWVIPYMDDILGNADPASRLGAAYAAVNIWAELANEEALHLLSAIVAKGEVEPWPAVLDIFRLVGSITPSPAWIELLRAIEKQLPHQKSFPSVFVIERLQTLLPDEAVLVGDFSLALTAKWQKDLADISTGAASAAPELVDIALTLHRLSDSTRELGIRLFEELLRINAYSAQDTLNQIDNRFSSRAPSPRARLPRRQRRPALRRA